MTLTVSSTPTPPRGAASPTPWGASYTSPFPIRSSPLANPPIYHPSRTPSPSQAKQRAVSIPTRSASGSYTRLARPSPLTASPNQHVDSSPFAASPSSPSPPLSRSQPLLGSFPLSLLHSRMSQHAPHSPPPDTFALHITAVGRGRSCRADLRNPSPLKVPLAATYYDMDSGPSAQTPYVGTVDLESYYFGMCQSVRAGASTSQGDADLPLYPGYEVAPVGQLQILVKTPARPIKVFVVPYDLRQLPAGGRLLARERCYASTSGRESLQYAYQLQLLCVDHNAIGTLPGATSENPSKRYYISRVIRVVFTTTPLAYGDSLRSERADEVVAPTDAAEPLSRSKRRQSFGFSPGSLGKRAEEWSMVRAKALARVAVDHANTPVPILHDAKPVPDFKPVPISRPATPFSPPSLLSTLDPRDDAPSRPASPMGPISPASTTGQTSPRRARPPVVTRPSFPAGPPDLLGSHRPISPQPQTHVQPVVWTPASQRRVRRGSIEERELSERLRALGLRPAD